MIFKRAVAKLRAQDWTAIAIELAIVIIGVFIGIQVSNWNQARVERRATAQLLGELRPALHGFIDYFDTAKPYYRTTRNYSNVALAGWRNDPAVSDEQFVIAAYQASQIYAFGLNGDSWTTIFGSDRLPSIEDPAVRRSLATLMTLNYQSIEAQLTTDYREQVRQVIPEDVQDAIRAACGDQPIPGHPLNVRLPPRCHVELADGRFASAASALRSHPKLIGELRWHRSTIASFIGDMAVVEVLTRDLLSRIEQQGGSLG